MAFDILALGELLIDFTPESAPGAEKTFYSQNPGGAPANVLAAAAALGAKGALVSRVGDDAFGRFLIDTVERHGIDASHVSKDPKVHTTLAFVCLDESGDRSFSFYRDPGADLMLSPADLPTPLFRESRIFHFGSLSMTAEPARSATLAALALAKQSGCLVSYDPNWRPSLWRNETEAVELMRAPLRQVDILKVSDEELELLSGTADLAEGSRRLNEAGPALVLVSLGAGGSFFRCGDVTGAVPAYDVKTVDTTGAGDAFLGAVLTLLKDRTRAELEALTEPELTAIAAFANAAGSLATTRKGAIAIMPDRAQVEECMKNCPKKGEN